MNAPLHHTGRVTILVGDVRERLRELADNSFDCVVTSPPYWGLRDYGVPGQIGLEPTLGEHLDVMVSIFRDVRRILKSHGTCWLNYGDCYAAAPNGKSAAAYKADGSDDRTFRDKPFSTVGPICAGASGNKGNVASDGVRRNEAGALYDPAYATARGKFTGTELNAGGIGTSRIEHGGRVVAGGFLKPKDLCMIPNRLAIALQDDGWYVRSEIIWHKPNPIPESVYDRPTSAHEKIWLLTKSEEYFYNHEAIREAVKAPTKAVGINSRENTDRVPRSRKIKVPAGWDVEAGAHGTVNRSGRTEATYKELPPKDAGREGQGLRIADRFGGGAGWRDDPNSRSDTRNARNVWTIAPRAFREAHFATFPPALAERCIKAGTPPTVCAACGAVHSCGGICQVFGRNLGRVLDPFGGAGTVGLVAKRLGLDSTLIELNPEYAAMAERRIAGAPA